MVVIASAVAHLAKGLDFEESTISLLLLGAPRTGGAGSTFPATRAAVQPVLVDRLAALGRGAADARHRAARRRAAGRLGDALRRRRPARRLRALFFWLRPLSEASRRRWASGGVARELVEKYGSDSLSFFALRRDKSFFFSPTRRAFLAYRVVSGAALVSGDPVGDAAEFDALLAEFRRVAHARGWRLAISVRLPSSLPRYQRLGMRAIAIGNEAVLRPDAFSLEGRAIRKVRQSVSRLTKAGYSLPRSSPPTTSTPSCARSSRRFRRMARQPGRAWLLDGDGRPLRRRDDVRGRRRRRRAASAGFMHMAPSPAGGGWSLSTMRRRPATPNGLMEFLVVETLVWAKERGVAEVSLNFCALADFLSPELAVTVPRRLLRRALLSADNVFQLERLHSFSRKFHPRLAAALPLRREARRPARSWGSHICGSSSS